MIRTPKVQTWLTQKITTYLSTELKTRIEITGVDIEFFDKIVLEGFYAEDLHKDTLIYVSRLKVSLSYLNIKQNNFHLRKISASDGSFFLKYYKNEKDINLGFILDYFASADTSSSNFKIACDNIQLENISFKYRDETEPQLSPGVDYFDIEARNIHAEITDILFEGDTLKAELKHLSLKEKSGFVLNELKCNAIIAPNLLSFPNLYIKTFSSEIHGEYAMKFNDYGDFSDFINKVQLKTKINNSKVAIRDVAFFAPVLFPLNKTVQIKNGEARGTVNNLKGKNLDIYYAENTHFSGDLSFSGLPEFNETYIDLLINDLSTTYADLKTIPAYPFESGETLFIPQQIEALGKLNFTGKFTGFVNDFVAYGSLNSQLGKVVSDVNLKYDNVSRNTLYSGHIETTNFMLGKLILKENLIGNISLSIDVNGSGFSKDKLAIGLVGNVSQLDFMNYNYNNINLKGHITGNIFEGLVNVKDENIDLDFNGLVNFSRNIPFFNLTVDVNYANLDKLKIVNTPLHLNPVLSSHLSLHFSGLDIDNFEGNIGIDQVHYSENGKEYDLDEFSLQAFKEGDKRNIIIKSDIADAAIKGVFKPTEIPNLLKNVFLRYTVKQEQNQNVETIEKSFFDFSANIKNTSAITGIFINGLELSENIGISGNMDSDKRNFRLDVDAPFVKYTNLKFNEIHIQSNENTDVYELGVQCKEIYVNDKLFLNTFSAKSELKHGMADFIIDLKEDKTDNIAQINGKIDITDFNSNTAKIMSVKFNPSVIHYKNSDWMLSSKGFIDIDTSKINIEEFLITNKLQSIKISGIISANPTDKMLIDVTEFQLENVQQFLTPYGIDLKGNMNGKVSVSGLYSGIEVSSNINIHNIVMNGDSLGKAIITTKWDHEKSIAEIDASLSIGNLKNIEIIGNVNLLSKENSLNLDIKLQKFKLKYIEKFVNDYISDIHGIATANAHLSGTFAKPYFEGKMTLQRSSFLFNYLNTEYNFSDEITFNSYEVNIKNVKLNDVNGNTAVANGKITHHNFNNMKYDIEIKAQNFQVLNTNAGQNDLYYGNAFITGSIQLLGTNENFKMNISAKSEKGSKKDKGTQIFIPLSNASEITTNNYIKFVSKGGTEKESKATELYKVDLSGIQMNFDLEVTPDAEIQLIFDSKVGDIMKGRGRGNLKMEINTLGNFNMYGDLVIEEGNYNLTLQNTISRHFQVEKGGFISWSGDPFEAEMKMRAVITVDAPLSDLVQSPEDKYKRKIPVECILDLNGKIMSPGIKFDLRVPGVDRETQDLINRSVPNEFEMNSQVFSLLVLKRFKAPESSEGKVQSGNIVQSSKANIYEFVASQFNNWLSQNNLGIDFDLKYTPGNLESKENILVGGKKGLFDDRIIIDAKVGNSQYTTSNLVGEFTLDVKASKDGKIRFKAFNKANNNNFTFNSSPYTQGVAVFYREEFDTLSELFRRYMIWRKEDKNEKNLN